jgi:Cof subfamily protein (haloacid dehalogenase superfamily)
MNSKIQLIVLDLDGTLLDEERRIPGSTVTLIQMVMGQGIVVTLASARPLCSMLPYVKQLRITVPVISLSGAYVTDRKEEKTLLKKPMNLAKFRKMIRGFEDDTFYIKVYSEDHLFVQEETVKTAQYSRTFGVPYSVVGRHGLSAMDKSPLRLALFNDSARIPEAVHTLKYWSDDFVAIRDTDHGLDIVEHTVSKGAALKVICQNFAIPLSNVMAIGNEGSDIAMVREAGLGIAMGNACEELKRYASYVTKTNKECGVEYAIQKYVLNV